MKIALAAAQVKNRDIEFNMAQITRFALAAKERGADLVCFGEAFLQGFDCLTWNYEQDRDMAVAVDSPLFQRLCRESERIGIDLLFGFIERADPYLYSSCALIEGGRLLHVYRRISQGWKEFWKTDGHYREGDAPECFSYRGKTCLITLCGDLWDFPERFRLGQDLLFWPVYISFTPQQWKEREGRNYAAQARLAGGTVLMVNSIERGGDAFGGCFRFEDGRAAAALNMEEEGLLTVEV